MKHESEIDRLMRIALYVALGALALIMIWTIWGLAS